MVGGTGYVLDNTDPTNWAWIYDTGGGEAADRAWTCWAERGPHARRTIHSASASGQRRAARRRPVRARPRPNDVYFNGDTVAVTIELNVAKSVTFEVDAFSSGPMTNWVLRYLRREPGTSSATPRGRPRAYLSFSIAGGFETDAGPQITTTTGRRYRSR